MSLRGNLTTVLSSYIVALGAICECVTIVTIIYKLSVVMQVCDVGIKDDC